MKTISKLYNFLSFLGVYNHSEHSISSQNHIIINRSIFWISIITFIYCIFYFIFKLYALLLAGLIYFLLWNLLYFLTQKGKFTSVKFLILFIGNLQLITLNYFAGGDAGIYIFFIPASIAPFLFYDKREKINIIFFTILSSFLSLICIYLKEKDISYYNKFDINFHLILYTLSMLSSIALSILFIGFLFYIKNIHAKLQEQEAENSESLLIALTESLTKTSKILDTSGEGYWFIQDTTITEINTSLAILLGRSKDDIIGKDISLFLDDLGLEIFKSDTRKIIIEKKITHELSLIKKNGTSVPCLLHSTFFEKDFDGKIGIFSFITDISEMKFFQKELIKSIKQAEEATKAKSLFLASISHEIRTPMNSIIGFSELAIDNRKPEKVLDYLTKIRNSAKSLLNIINDLLDFSKIESGKIEIESLPFSLKSLLEDIQTMLDQKLKEKKLSFSINYKNELPDFILGDSTRVQQILLNLLYNSIKFTEKGDVSISIQIEKEDEFSILIQFIVMDTGIGITEEQQKKLFKPFSQAENSIHRKFGGTGLGLSIIKKLLELMNGNISVESTPEEGSKFIFTIPFQKVTEKEYAVSKTLLSPQKLNLDHLENLSNLNILVVDDNEINREIIIEQLSSVNINTTEAIHGKECLDILNKNNNFQCIIMDLQMPVLDGIETTRIIKNTPELSSIPIIILSANGYKEEIDRCKKLGISDFLIKPVDSVDLLNCITKLIPIQKDIQNKNDDVSISMYLPEIDGLDTSGGLRRMMGNHTAYLELLKKFNSNQRTALERIRLRIEEGDYESLYREFHSLSGVSSNLGAIEISKLARSIETKIKNNEEESKIKSEISILIDKLTSFLDDLEQFFKIAARN